MRPERELVALEDLPDKVVFTNARGKWHIWKQLTWSPDGTKVVGPGYIGRLERPDGFVVVDDFKEPGPLNDPRFGGLGAFGWQHARTGQEKWDVHGRLDAAETGFGVARAVITEGPEIGSDGAGSVEIRVELRDGWTDPIMAVSYCYRFEEHAVLSKIVAEQLWSADGIGQPFVKEPKLVASVSAPVDVVEVYAEDGAILRTIDLGDLPDPWEGTAQIADEDRAGVRFAGPDLDIGLDGSDLERWAELAEVRPQLSPKGRGYCLTREGTLKRRWEIAKRREEPDTSCMFHAWEGGSGYPDCENASRAFGPTGEGFTIAVRYA